MTLQRSAGSATRSGLGAAQGLSRETPGDRSGNPQSNLLMTLYGKDTALAVLRAQPVVRNVVRMSFKRGVPPWVKGGVREILSWANKEIAKIRASLPSGCLTERAFLKRARFNIVGEFARQDGFNELASMLDALHREMNHALAREYTEVAEALEPAPSRPDAAARVEAIL